MNTNSVQQISESRYSAESTIAKVAANSECEFQYYYRLDIAINRRIIMESIITETIVICFISGLRSYESNIIYRQGEL